MDLPDLDTLSAAELTTAQIQGILAQIDLDITNLVRDGKLSALKYGLTGPAGHQTDRAANLHALLAARDYYQQLLANQPAWVTSVATCCCSH
ncbi:MAG: hypothetical protein ACK5Q5_20045 [Planctomycetaceae bacterium]